MHVTLNAGVRSVDNGSILLVIALAAILQSTLSKVIGRQFCNSSNEPSSFGIRVIIPLRCDVESSFTS